MPDFIVLQTTTPPGVQKVWTELARPSAKDAASAFAAAPTGMATGDYLVLPLAEQFTASVKTTVTTSAKG